MGKIIGIAASSFEGIVSIDNKMPWDVPEDLKYFKNCTTHNVVIMGRVTWETLNKKCLSNRINYVVSKNGLFTLVEGSCATIFCDINQAIIDAQLKYPDKDIFIIGGASIYKQTLPIMDEFFLTIINKEEINYKNGEIKSLDLKTLDNLFIEVASSKGQYATYKKYERKVINRSNSKGIFS